MTEEPLRRDPDRLLEKVSRPSRGKLKIFFGACAGVGKTYAMLQEAQRLRAQGLDILVGTVETHGRKDTAELLNGLSIQPLRRTVHRGRLVEEFDLDTVLARRPAMILMDELAHSNVPGSRHPKRWQDIEELLSAGIDVLTTINVQHLESLNDVVGGITGIQVRETIPDPFFDAADEIVLVDLPPDDLRQRLHEGKVYLAGQAERAIEHFFRKGNLIALRELALRRAADRVDDQMRAWREDQGQNKVWHTRDTILLCIGHNAGNEKLVRTAARLAARLGCVWHAIYVETPRLHRLPEYQRHSILAALRLAQELGAETATLADPHRENAVIRYAREHNLGKIILGRHTTSARWWYGRTFADRLGPLAPDLDLVIVALDENASFSHARAPDTRSMAEKWRMQLRGSVIALLLCALISFVASQWLGAFETANLVMIYLLGVVIIALFYGRWPSVLAAIINVISFDLFFIAPHGTLAVSDMQYLLTFAVMLTVGLVIGNLTAGVRYQARVARYREQRTRQLYEMSKALADDRSTHEVASTSIQFINTAFKARSLLLLPDAEGKLCQISAESTSVQWDEAIARWSFDNGQPAGAGTDTLPAVPYQILPLRTAERIFGLLVLEPSNLRLLITPEQQRLLETFTLLIATTLDRLLLTESEQQARMAGEREQLRNALLAALSHDLRTPLTVLLGKAELLAKSLAKDNSRHLPQADDICQHVINTARLVNNLLDMARIQSEGFRLHKEWLTLEEVVGSALKMFEPALGAPHVHLDIPTPLKLIQVDGTLFERVLINLLENAAKYAGPAAQIGVHATVNKDRLELDVWDSGPGIPADQTQAIFDKFSRGTKESAIPGVGLGLAICRAIVELHGGTICAGQHSRGGASFQIRLPQPPAPVLPDINEVT